MRPSIAPSGSLRLYPLRGMTFALRAYLNFIKQTQWKNRYIRALRENDLAYSRVPRFMAQRSALRGSTARSSPRRNNLHHPDQEMLTILCAFRLRADDFRIFCGDLGNEVTDNMLESAFKKYPSFQKARVVRDKKTGKSKGFGFVSLKDPNDYMQAMREMNSGCLTREAAMRCGSRFIALQEANFDFFPRFLASSFVAFSSCSASLRQTNTSDPAQSNSANQTGKNARFPKNN